MLRYKTESRLGLVALYDIRPGNGAGQFLQPRSLHGARLRGNSYLRPKIRANSCHQFKYLYTLGLKPKSNLGTNSDLSIEVTQCSSRKVLVTHFDSVSH